MTMSAYDKIYLEDAEHNLGAMVDCAVCTMGCPAEQFWSRFLASSISDRFSRGAVDIIAGHSGTELAMMVMGETGSAVASCRPEISISSPEYWAGTALARYQWSNGLSFKELSAMGLGLRSAIDMFNPLHEADMSTFCRVADEIIGENYLPATRLKRMRKLGGMTQADLAARSGVHIRLIRAYEQNAIDIRHAEASTVLKLAGALHIPPGLLG